MDRKSLLRDYKESTRPVGVFQIRNTKTGKLLVAAGVNLPAAINGQKWQLKMGMHPNRALQADWNAHGLEAFVFEILDEVKASDEPDYDATRELAALEQLWLDKLSPFDDRGYNVRAKPQIT